MGIIANPMDNKRHKVEEEPTFIEEASTKYEKKYKCPYCNNRYTRKNLCIHIGNKHDDLIPKDMTPLRITFNTINHKDHGTCVICKGESPWNEAKGRYDRICTKNSCHDAYVKEAKERMKRTYGKEHLLNDPNVQIKMLQNRKISGSYTWSDGTKKEYCGSYEKKLLEFLDKVIQCKSEDIVTPGPVIDYTYNNETHQWITDLYYIPYNLCFDVKDGGDNPNTRDMSEYRAKQVAKEISIMEQKKYNYIRLTDNNFEQLLSIFFELKMRLDDDPIVRIHEQCSTTMNVVPPIKAPYIVNYKMKNSFIDGYGYTTNNELTDDIYIIDEYGKKKKINRNEFMDIVESYEVYRYNGNYIPYIEYIDEAKDYNIDYFYEALTGRRLFDKKQLVIDENFKKDNTLEDILDSIRETTISSIINTIPDGKGISIDENGYFLYNNGIRSKSYDNIEQISESTIFILDKN